MIPHVILVDLKKRGKKSKKFVPVQIIDNLSWEEFARLNSNLYRLKGVFPSEQIASLKVEVDKMIDDGENLKVNNDH